eukprot:TRINITY_DN48436_c0_g1_i1.p1 TRINITY_DN48436_c0_g1~~TRINITY_DN48436_c0_g1_i1.p1  ORF type:complete len:100 (-),score=19.25 TRINITY_DN48436_c0_g1_i1:94-393(-)
MCIRDSAAAARQARITSLPPREKRIRDVGSQPEDSIKAPRNPGKLSWRELATKGQFPCERWGCTISYVQACLLYTSDAADEEDSVDLGGRRIIEKKKIE